MISSPNTMLTVLWNSHGFHVVKISPRDARGQAKITLMIFFPKSTLFALQEIEAKE
jgi:hypothetical protein